MIRLFKQWRAKRAHAKRIAKCRHEGHWMVRCGELQESKMIGGAPVAIGPVQFWLFQCVNKCGHGEVNDIHTKPYARSFVDAEKLVREQSKEKKDG